MSSREASTNVTFVFLGGQLQIAINRYTIYCLVIKVLFFYIDRVSMASSSSFKNRQVLPRLFIGAIHFIGSL